MLHLKTLCMSRSRLSLFLKSLKNLPYYSIITRSVPSSTESPLLTLIAVTLPSLSALMLFSIFIASRMIRVCPFLTVSPTLTFTSRITPGSGDLTPDLPPATAGLEIPQ